VDEYTRGRAPSGFATRLSSSPPGRQGTWIIFGGIVAVVLSVASGMSFLTPVLTGAALGPFFYGAMKRNDLRNAFSLTARWAVSVFITSCIVCMYLPGRTVASIPFADTMIRSFTTWLSGGSNGAPFGPAMMLGGVLLFVVLSLVSGGLAAILACGGAICGAAGVFSHMMRHGDNIFHITLLGLPPWIIAFALSVLFLVVPTALPFYKRIHGNASTEADTAIWRTYAIIGAALALAGIVLYLTLNSTWNTLLNACTVL
jgi:hypothetical protein